MKYFEVIRALNGEYMARFRDSENREKIWWTETYRRKSTAYEAIDLIQRFASISPTYDRT